MPTGQIKSPGTLKSPSYDFTFPGFKIVEILSENGSGFALYRATREKDQRHLLIKSTVSGSPEMARQLENDYQLVKDLDLGYVTRPLQLERFDNRSALIFDDFGGRPLKGLLGLPMETGRFLRIATRLAVGLEEIHAHNIIHQDLNPKNIFVDPQTDQVKIGSFGMAIPIAYDFRQIEGPTYFEGKLPYQSPERTGRMNRPIDYRSDLYSLGINFYEMLTGKLPLQSKSPLDWVHFHVARTPKSPAEINSKIPKLISDMVMKLLSKDAENRYQSAYGLKLDLQRCLDQWETTKQIHPFPLAQKDLVDKFQIPSKLYGREIEISALLQAFDQVLESGIPKLILVSGRPGIGKSSMIRELYRPTIRNWGFPASAKFDQFKSDIPYSTLAQAFRSVVQQILTEHEEYVFKWKKDFQEALGSNAQLIIDMIPEIESILGPQPPVAKLPITDERNRFVTVFTRFIEVFAKRKHPLALFLDDLQWADTGSLELIRDILASKKAQYLLLIGAYRNNEIFPNHPLSRMVDEIRETGTIIQEIHLGPLKFEDLNCFIADLLHSVPEKTKPFGELVLQKTRGNPLFVIQFLSALRKEHLLQFNRRDFRWNWDLNQIQMKGYTDNVVDFIVANIRKLSQKSQEMLNLAACIGSKADLTLLSRISEKPEWEVIHHLSEAAREGLVLNLNSSYQFPHDRIRQAAYSLIPSEKQKRLHLRIGWTLLTLTPPIEIKDKIFEIINHINLSASLITRKEERCRVAELNLIAGKRAKISAAYRSAANYLNRGIEQLPEDSWQSQYELTYALHYECAQCEFLDGKTEVAEGLYAILHSKARNDLERAQIFQIEVHLFVAKGDLVESIARGLNGLKLLGIEIPKHPTWEKARAEYEKVWRILEGQNIEALIRLPSMTDPAMQIAQEIFASIVTPAVSMDDNLFLLCSSHMVQISLKNGYSAASPLGFVVFGTCLDAMFRRYKDGYFFGKLGYDLMNQRNFLTYKPQTTFFFGTCTLFKHRNLQESLRYAHFAYQSAIEMGNLNYNTYSLINIIFFRFIAGEHLGKVAEAAKNALDFSYQMNFEPTIHIFTAIRQLIRNLMGQTASFSSFNDSVFNEEEYDTLMNHSPIPATKCWYNIWKLQARFLSGDYPKAIAAARNATCTQIISTLIPGFEYHYYLALSLAAHYSEVSDEQKQSYLKELDIHLARLDEVAQTCPETFLNKYLLVSAEIARIKGDDLNAMQLYEKAIHSARTNGFLQNEAIGFELAARFYRSRGLATAADHFLQQASSRYCAWGALGKTNQLGHQYPQVTHCNTLSQTDSIEELGKRMDALAVVKASQAISREIELSKLLKELMQIVIENAGAEKAYLLIARDHTLWIEAEVETGKEMTRIFPAISAQHAQFLPQGIINYVMRTRQRVVLDDASSPNIFSLDTYIDSQKPKSLLCFPILLQNELFGLIYLENNLTSGAFAPERLALLELLASQAAISLRNSLLYSNLKRTEQALRDALRIRDEFLSIASHELRTPLTSLRPQIQMVKQILQNPKLAALPETKNFPKMLQIADQEMDRLVRLIRDLLDVSRIRSGHLTVNRQQSNLSRLIQATIGRLQPQFEVSRCPVEIHIEPDIEGKIDESAMIQVVENLLSNALKFGIGAPIEISLTQRGERAKLIIRDHGIGIDKEDQEKIFDRFDRGSSGEKFGGLGLGLYISRQIINAHGGTVWVESEKGHGSTFIIELPLD